MNLLSLLAINALNGGGGGGSVSVDNITLQKTGTTLKFKIKTAAEKEKVWKVQADGTWDLENINEWKSVNTFSGITPNDYTLYILLNDITISDVDYVKGMYIYRSGDYQRVTYSVDNDTTELNSDNEIQANAIIELGSGAFPVTDIKTKTYYRKSETVTWTDEEEVEHSFTMTKLYLYIGANWVSQVNIELTNEQYEHLTTAQKQDGTVYIVNNNDSTTIVWDYLPLANKPTYDGITIVGNLTREDLNLYNRNEIDTLLAGKGSAEFVEYLPTTLVALTWYYSEHFADGTLVPNDNNALYIIDKDGVSHYMGIVGSVDISDCLIRPRTNYTFSDGDTITQEALKSDITERQPIKINGITYENKQDSTTQSRYSAVIYSNSKSVPTICVAIIDKTTWVVSLKIDNVQPVTMGHLIYSGTSGIASNNAVFDFTDCGLTANNSRVIETRVFQGNMTNPITSETINGENVVNQYMVFSGGAFTIYIEQTFTQHSSGTRGNVIKFRRTGNVALDSLSQYTNWVASKSADITWNAWIPIEYPITSVALTTGVTGTGAYYSVTGGILTVVINNIKSSNTSNLLTIGTLPASLPFKYTNGNQWASMMNWTDKTAQLVDVHNNTKAIRFYAYNTANKEIYGILSIPLGY